MATKELTTFGRRLERVTKEKGLTDSELSQKLKMAQPQLFLLKRTALPRERTLKKLSKVLNKPVEFWLAGIPKAASRATTRAVQSGNNASELHLLSKKLLARETMPKGTVLNGVSLDQLKVYLVFEVNGLQRKIQLL
jgi:transcriptional regulator with XRE-family HTH domain